MLSLLDTAPAMSKGLGAREVLRTWFDETSIVGLSHASHSKPLWLKAAWSVVFVVGMAITVAQVYHVIELYLAYPISTAVTLTHAHHLRFPAVTVCNLNRVHCHNLGEVLEHGEGCAPDNASCQLSSRYPGTNLTWMDLQMFSIFTGCSGDSSEEATELFGDASTPEVDLEGNQIDPVVAVENKFLQDFVTLPVDLRSDIGHGYKDFIRSCSFKGQDCRKEHLFLKRATPLYGNCFTFNHALNEADKTAGNRMLAVTGSHHGLQLTLNLDQTQYMKSGISQSEGVRVAVSDPNVMILPGAYGTDVQPNTRTSMALQNLDITRMPAPYSSNCTAGWNETFYTDFNETEYTLLQCQRFCYFFLVRNRCNCTHPMFMSISSYLTPYYDKPVCHITTVKSDSNVTAAAKSEYQCIKSLFDELDKGDVTCDGCGVPCEEEDYHMIITTSKWPSKTFERSAYDNYIEPFLDPDEMAEHNVTEDELESHVAMNLVRLEVFYETLNVEMITESATYTYATLLTDLGGALSLMLGISIGMVFEFVFVCIQLMCSIGKKLT